jgi:PIN domain nuclease of toxin-antitoxin system
MLHRSQAIEIARLGAHTRTAALSLADRACFALARQLDAPVLTADRLWSSIAVGVEVRLIR